MNRGSELGPREVWGIHKRFPGFSKIYVHIEMPSSPLPPCLGIPPLTHNSCRGVSFQIQGSLPLEAWTQGSQALGSGEDLLEILILSFFSSSTLSITTPHPQPSLPEVASDLWASVGSLLALAGREGQTGVRSSEGEGFPRAPLATQG